MAPESETNLRLKIGHVLFIDLVGYSKLLIEEQKERQRRVHRHSAGHCSGRYRDQRGTRAITDW